MKLVIILNQNRLQLKIRQKGGVLDPALERGRKLKDGRKPAPFKGGVDSETFSYYHDISEKLTPLEVSAIKRRGFIKRDKTVIYGELLTGLITSLDKLLKRNSIDTTALNSFKIQGNTDENSTSYKIAAAFVEGLKAGA